MKTRSKGMTVALAAAILSALPATAQEAKPQLAEEVFKNVQVLKGMTVNEFMETMGFFSASTLLNCADCHTKESSGDWAKYADETPLKKTARRMVTMMRGINQANFSGRQAVTCFTCHRGDERPRAIPDLTEMYSMPPPPEPDQLLKQAEGAPPAESLLDKYIEALGGAQKVGSVTSLIATGVYEGSPVSLMPGDSPLELYAKAPNQRTLILHADAGDATTSYDGRAAWSAAPSVSAPVPVVPLTGTDLDAANVEAMLTFPGRIKQSLTNWRSGFPYTIDGNEVQVVQGTSPGKLPVLLYFDSKSGLLARMVRYKNLAIGRIPIRTDYSDYRDVSGIKMPFRIKLTDVAGQGTIRMTDVNLNAPIDASKFAKPSPPAARKTTTP
jgi:photosynthetic reaction center cytochrome c subunit